MTVESTLPNGLKTSVLGSQYKTEYDENLNLVDGHLGNVGNPHAVTAVQAGAEPTLGFTPEDSANKGVNGGYVELDVNGYAVGNVLATRIIAGLIDPARFPAPTELLRGGMMIASSTYSRAGINDVMAITPKKAFDIINASPNRNVVLNGDFDIWQRGASFSTPTSNAYNADRWLTTYNGAGSTFTISKQAFALGQIDVPNEPESYLRYDVTAAGSSETYRQLRNIMESVRSFAGKKITLSLWIKASAGITLANVRLLQYFGTGGTPSSAVYTTFGSSIAVTTTWTRLSATITVPSISGKTIGSNSNDYIALAVGLPVNSAFQLDIAQFQLELGEVATTFAKRTLAAELDLCQRYYIDFAGRTINGDFWVSWPKQMRSAPTLTATVGTAANATVNGCTVNHSAASATTITASAEM